MQLSALLFPFRILGRPLPAGLQQRLQSLVVLGELVPHLLQRFLHPADLSSGVRDSGIHIPPEAGIARLHPVQEPFRRRPDPGGPLLRLPLDGPGPLVRLQLDRGRAVFQLVIGLGPQLPAVRAPPQLLEALLQGGALPALPFQLSPDLLQFPPEPGGLRPLVSRTLFRAGQLLLQRSDPFPAGGGLCLGGLPAAALFVHRLLEGRTPLPVFSRPGLYIIEHILPVEAPHHCGAERIFYRTHL